MSAFYYIDDCGTILQIVPQTYKNITDDEKREHMRKTICYLCNKKFNRNERITATVQENIKMQPM